MDSKQRVHLQPNMDTCDARTAWRRCILFHVLHGRWCCSAKVLAQVRSQCTLPRLIAGCWDTHVSGCSRATGIKSTPFWWVSGPEATLQERHHGVWSFQLLERAAHVRCLLRFGTFWTCERRPLPTILCSISTCPQMAQLVRLWGSDIWMRNGWPSESEEPCHGRFLIQRKFYDSREILAPVIQTEGQVHSCRLGRSSSPQFEVQNPYK